LILRAFKPRTFEATTFEEKSSKERGATGITTVAPRVAGF